MQRARRYWQVDGITEIGISFFLGILGLFFFLESALPQQSLGRTMLDSAFILIFLGGAFLARAVTSFLRQRITYPRTGYVESKRSSERYRPLTMGLALLVAVLIAAMFASAPRSLDWMPAVSGLIFAVILIIFALRGAAPRFIILGLLSLLAGLSLGIAGIGDILGMASYYASMAAALLISGLLTLRVYLRRTSREAAPAEEA
jgi:hypothetical protein